MCVLLSYRPARDTDGPCQCLIASATITGAGTVRLACPRVCRDIGRRRARAERVGEVLVLGDLRGLELEALVLIAEALGLLIREVIDDAVADLVDGLHRGRNGSAGSRNESA